MNRHRYDHAHHYSTHTVVLRISPVALVFLALAVLAYHTCSSPVTSVIVVGGVFLITAAVVGYIVSDLIHRLNQKRLNIGLMDRQLLKMSRLAATSNISRNFLIHLKNILINIDSSAVLGLTLIRQNDSAELKQNLEQIKTEAIQAHKTIEKILTLTRPPEDQWVIQDVDINQLITDLLELYAGQLSSRQIRLHQSLAARLPMVRSNFSRLYQALQNLFTVIAADIRQDGGLTVETTGLDQEVCIEVSYPSRHFNQHVLHRLSDPAYALQSKDPGPWLVLCMYHVQRINGHLTAHDADSELKFRITLPYRMMRMPRESTRKLLNGL